MKLCAGVYILGCQRAFSANNNIVITRMEPGSEGKKWTPPTQLTTGLSVVTINSGVPSRPLFPSPSQEAPHPSAVHFLRAPLHLATISNCMLTRKRTYIVNLQQTLCICPRLWAL